MAALDFSHLFAFCDLHTSRWLEREQWAFNILGAHDVVPMYYDRQGFPIPRDLDKPAVVKWAQLSERDDYKRVASDPLPDGSFLSTIWLGLDHGFGVERPLIFETMRFGEVAQLDARYGPLEGKTYRRPLEFPDPRTGELTEQMRYATEEEARACHREIVERLMESMRAEMSS